MIGNALGYSAVTCFMLLSSSCATLKGSESPPQTPPEAAPQSSQPRGESGGGSAPVYKAPTRQPRAPSAPIQLGPETAAQIRQGAGPAVKALLDKAAAEKKAGDTGQAIATLERALNIEPRNPQLYRQLALLHMANGDAVEAESLALKSNSLAGDDRGLRARNWRLIAKARQAQKNDAGAADANRKANNLGNGLPAGQ